MNDRKEELLNRWSDLISQSVTTDMSEVPPPIRLGFMMLDEGELAEYLVVRAAELRKKDLPPFAVVEVLLGVFISGLALGWSMDDDDPEELTKGFEIWVKEGGVQKAIVRAAKSLLSEGNEERFSFFDE